MATTGNDLFPQRVIPTAKRARILGGGRGAVLLSAFVYPGAGQFVQRRWVAGVAMAGTFTVSFILFTVYAFYILRAYYRFLSDIDAPAPRSLPTGPMFLALLGCLALWALNLIDVYAAARRQRRDAELRRLESTIAGDK